MLSLAGPYVHKFRPLIRERHSVRDTGDDVKDKGASQPQGPSSPLNDQHQGQSPHGFESIVADANEYMVVVVADEIDPGCGISVLWLAGPSEFLLVPEHIGSSHIFALWQADRIILLTD